jgi:hypothetical protein
MQRKHRRQCQADAARARDLEAVRIRAREDAQRSKARQRREYQGSAIVHAPPSSRQMNYAPSSSAVPLPAIGSNDRNNDYFEDERRHNNDNDVDGDQRPQRWSDDAQRSAMSDERQSKSTHRSHSTQRPDKEQLIEELEAELSKHTQRIAMLRMSLKQTEMDIEESDSDTADDDDDEDDDSDDDDIGDGEGSYNDVGGRVADNDGNDNDGGEEYDDDYDDFYDDSVGDDDDDENDHSAQNVRRGNHGIGGGDGGSSSNGSTATMEQRRRGRHSNSNSNSNEHTRSSGSSGSRNARRKDDSSHSARSNNGNGGGGSGGGDERDSQRTPPIDAHLRTGNLQRRINLLSTECEKQLGRRVFRRVYRLLKRREDELNAGTIDGGGNGNGNGDDDDDRLLDALTAVMPRGKLRYWKLVDQLIFMESNA